MKSLFSLLLLCSFICKAQLFNICDYGAISDTTTDNATAIKRAILSANGKVVWIPKGVFYSSKITINQGVKINIDGVGTIKSHTSQQLGHHIFQFEKSNHVNVKNITLDGNIGNVVGSPASGVILMKIWNCKNTVIEGVIFKCNSYLGASCVNDTNIVFKHCKFINTDAGVITQGGCFNVLIKNNYFLGGTSEGVSIYGDTYTSEKGIDRYVTIIDNTVINKTASSAYHIRLGNCIIVKNNFADNCKNGVGGERWKTTNLTISANIIKNCSIGIKGNMSNSLINSNSISNADGTGIWLGSDSAISNNIISKNIITDVNRKGRSDDGIRLTRAINNIIRNNSILSTRKSNNTFVGIRISGNNSSNNQVLNNKLQGVNPVLSEKGAKGTIIK